MKVLKVILTIAAFVIVGILALVIAWLAIPAERSFTNEIEINVPADTVWRVITDREHYTEWQTGLNRVEIVDDRHWLEHVNGGPGPLKFTEIADDRPKSMEFAYSIDENLDGGWKGTITPTATGSRLTTVDSYRAKDLFTKLLVPVFFNLDRFAKDWNQQLKTRAETIGDKR